MIRNRGITNPQKSNLLNDYRFIVDVCVRENYVSIHVSIPFSFLKYLDTCVDCKFSFGRFPILSISKIFGPKIEHQKKIQNPEIQKLIPNQNAVGVADMLSSHEKLNFKYNVRGLFV